MFGKLVSSAQGNCFGCKEGECEVASCEKTQSREISAFCPSFDKAYPKSLEPLEFPIRLRDGWATSQGVDVILAITVFSGDADKLEMPPEERNWEGSWKRWHGEQWKELCALTRRRYAWRSGRCRGEWQAIFRYLKCCQVEERLQLYCAAPEGILRARESTLQGKRISCKAGSI